MEKKTFKDRNPKKFVKKFYKKARGLSRALRLMMSHRARGSFFFPTEKSKKELGQACNR